MTDWSSEVIREMRQALEVDGHVESVVVGTSMRPTLLSGDIVRVEPCRVPRRGMIVQFVDVGGRVVTHRVVSVADGLVTCRGDNRLGYDASVALPAIIGRVTASRDRGQLRQDGVAMARVEARLWVRRRRQAGVRLWREAALARDQAAGLCPPYQPAGRLREEAERVVMPAELYSRLGREERRALVADHVGRRLEISAYSLRHAGLPTRLSAALRRRLADAGRPVGQPGDAMLPLGGAFAFAHFFLAEEFHDELTGWGCRDVRVRVVRDGSRQTLRAECKLPGPQPGQP